MHEWSLAEAVIHAASKIVEREGLKEVREVVIRVGELQQIELEVLEFALTELKKGTRFEDAEFVLETMRAEFECRVCGHRWYFDAKELDERVQEDIHFVPEVVHAYVRCPRCGSPDFNVLKGRGVWIERIRGLR
ncbi:hydrogenase nickel insertion protein HypA [Candidatus Bathyarchaeota archaeon]|nr:hydrogenase nickel incorporation protein HypA [Candidatus Bathyarchaeota archaeon]RJS89656.1 MAG: hydrogenase nickel incorporation protein HypA [Candidatus Bathyarchaeota archaeon]RLI34074.1 MAG: hydrogenase nickel insertion protein HypA [Candidatus Bathyarchaeota archaeon]